MDKRFTERLRHKVDSIWEAQHQHPFVRGIGNGTLDIEKFKVWVRQDYLFLIDYGRWLAQCRRKSPWTKGSRLASVDTQSGAIDRHLKTGHHA